MVNTNYKGCGTCAHATGVPTNTKFYCKLWGCQFLKIKSCTYYHRFDEPVNPFEGKRTPSERELDLMHLRRYCALEHMEENERRGFLDWHKEFYKTYKNHF